MDRQQVAAILAKTQEAAMSGKFDFSRRVPILTARSRTRLGLAIQTDEFALLLLLTDSGTVERDMRWRIVRSIASTSSSRDRGPR
jgi:hypothetical protein